MRELLFGNPIFHNGLNYTVRLGEKWRNIGIGEYVKTPTGFAEIVEVHVCRLGNVPDRVLANDHDPFCNDRLGLSLVMEKVYPQLNSLCREDQDKYIVTCLGFEIFEKRQS